MPLSGITAASGVVLAPERVSNSVENQNQRQQELRERVEATRPEVSTSASTQGSVSLAAIRPITAPVFNSLDDGSEQLLSPEEVVELELEAKETVQLQQQGEVEAEVVEEELSAVEEEEVVVEEAEAQAAQEELQVVQQQEESTAAQLFVVQQENETQASFAQLSRARDAFDAALSLQASVEADAAFVESSRASEAFTVEANDFRLLQQGITESINDNNTVRENIFIGEIERDTEIDADVQERIQPLDISV